MVHFRAVALRQPLAKVLHLHRGIALEQTHNLLEQIAVIVHGLAGGCKVGHLGALRCRGFWLRGRFTALHESIQLAPEGLGVDGLGQIGVHAVA